MNRMFENASHIVVHHRLSGLADMTCCVALIAVVVVILLVSFLLVSFALFKWRCSRHSRRGRDRPSEFSLKTREQPINFVNTSDRAAAAATTTASEVEESGSQRVPLENPKEDDRYRDDSESSGGLYDVLFPPQQDEEVIYEPPKVVAFAGQVFASTGGRGSRPASNVTGDTLEWDYYHQQKLTDSELKSYTVDTRRIIDVCWV